MENPKILSTLNLRHVVGTDSRDWVVIYEYKSLNDVVEVDEVEGKLYGEGWPDLNKRMEFWSAFGKYWSHSSSELSRSDRRFEKTPKK